MIGHAVGQAVGQGGRSRRSVGQRFMTGYDRPMTDHDRPLPSLVIILFRIADVYVATSGCGMDFVDAIMFVSDQLYVHSCFVSITFGSPN